MSSERLAVLLHGEIVGHLERADSQEDPSFTYTSDYVSDGTIALSARLPIQSTRFSSDKVMPYLLGLVPENSDARERWARRLQVSPDDAFGMLATMGWDCPGAVQFCRPDQLDELSERRGEYVAIDDAAIADRIRSLDRREASWTMPEEHWSLGGQQEKFALAFSNGQWLEAHGSAATTHIIKPGISSLKHQALVEHVTMRAAALVSVDVARTEFRKFDDTWALVVERFDRVIDQSTAIRRVHQEDFCQAVGRTPDRKYEDRGGPTLKDMAQVINRESVDLPIDRIALAEFAIINLIAGAPDGHAKNVALLRRRGGSTIAPLFDLATGLAYDSNTVDRKVALSIGGERWASRIHSKQWDKLAATLSVDPVAMKQRATDLAEEFPSAFETALNEVGNAPGVDEVKERTLARLSDHSRVILAALAAGRLGT